MVHLESGVINNTFIFKQKQKICWGVKDPRLRVGMKGYASEHMRIPQWQLSGFHSGNYIALPYVVLVEKIATENFPFR